jgi:molybdate/tungstate transport system substrate-binding protein
MGKLDRSRRSVLRDLGAAGTAVIGGCTGITASANSETVEVLAAGSLTVLLGEHVGPRFETATGVDVRGEFHGSKALLRMIEEGQQRPDVALSADASLLREALYPEHVGWDLVFASNALGIAYAPNTDLGARLDGGEPWHRAVRESDGRIARTDPDLDPLGYRTLMLFDLAERYYGVHGLAAALRANSVVDPAESHLLAAIETGNRPAAVCYRNMAVARDLSFVGLPDALNFSSPAHADRYRTAQYVADDGQVLRGGPILYSAAVLDDAENPQAGRKFVEFLLANAELIEEYGLIVREDFPGHHGAVPQEVLP